MFYWIVVSLAVIVTGSAQLAWSQSKTKGTHHMDDGWEILGVCLVIVAVILFLVGFGANGIHQVCAYWYHVSNQEEIVAQDNILKIHRDRQDRLIEDFRVTLAQEYPDHELEVFGSMQGMLAMYPQLRASETAIKFVDQLRELEDEVVRIRERREEALWSIRVRERSPWVWIPLPDNK